MLTQTEAKSKSLAKPMFFRRKMRSRNLIFPLIWMGWVVVLSTIWLISIELYFRVERAGWWEGGGGREVDYKSLSENIPRPCKPFNA